MAVAIGPTPPTAAARPTESDGAAAPEESAAGTARPTEREAPARPPTAVATNRQPAVAGKPPVGVATKPTLPVAVARPTEPAAVASKVPASVAANRPAAVATPSAAVHAKRPAVADRVCGVAAKPPASAAVSAASRMMAVGDARSSAVENARPATAVLLGAGGAWSCPAATPTVWPAAMVSGRRSAVAAACGKMSCRHILRRRQRWLVAVRSRWRRRFRGRRRRRWWVGAVCCWLRRRFRGRQPWVAAAGFGGVVGFAVVAVGGGRSFPVASQISRLATVTRAAAIVRMGVMDSADGGAAPASGRAEPALVAEHGQSRGDGAWPVPR